MYEKKYINNLEITLLKRLLSLNEYDLTIGEFLTLTNIIL